MNKTFDRFYRILGRVTLAIFLLGLTFFGSALLFALLGFANTATSFSGVAAAIAYVFGALFTLFLLMSLVAALIRWLDRRSEIRRQST